MTDFEKIWSFENLYRAHRAARLGKRDENEVIRFEMRLGENLTRLSDELREGNYQLSGYYSFLVHDPKDRVIHALHYRDRVVQHCICDEVLAPLLDRKLIYDNAACRIGKGTHFALERVEGFLREHFRKHGAEGYVLKCDIRKFFQNIDHEILKKRLVHAVKDPQVLQLLFQIIDSYEDTPGKGIPLGNQTSQWFAIYYLDGFDRLIKEQLRIRHYSRYMDDSILIHPDKAVLQDCLREMDNWLTAEAGLEFNRKTQISPLKNGFTYLGWHFYLTETGKAVRKLGNGTKKKYKRRLTALQKDFEAGRMELAEIGQVLQSYHAHFQYGHTWKLENKALSEFCLRRSEENRGEKLQ